ncbi:PaaI family thioesterase [Haloarchaeobius sp. DFWS5]|uniref:PaaI family thioesterase n=1 Tax=Haloarchaeobius sp. DFWS5 TaxID=3446114 RepID=UPI003EB93F02
MSIEAIFDAMPYAEHLGIEISEAADGYAAGSLELESHHSSVPGTVVAHGGVVHSFADHLAGAAVISLAHRPTPTIDIRIDHLSPATEDLVGEAEVVRNGNSVATVDATVETESGRQVATARGVYKTSGGDDGSAWMGNQESFPTEE